MRINNTSGDVNMGLEVKVNTNGHVKLDSGGLKKV